jgi:hypothetical protein
LESFQEFGIKRVRFKKLIGIQLDPAGGDDELEKIFLPSLTLKYKINEKNKT